MKNKKNHTSGRKRGKQIAALAGVVLLLTMVIATFVVACLKFDGSDRIFKGLLCCDIAVPILLWFYLYLYNRAGKTDQELAERYSAGRENADVSGEDAAEAEDRQKEY